MVAHAFLGQLLGGSSGGEDVEVWWVGSYDCAPSRVHACVLVPAHRRYAFSFGYVWVWYMVWASVKWCVCARMPSLINTFGCDRFEVSTTMLLTFPHWLQAISSVQRQGGHRSFFGCVSTWTVVWLWQPTAGSWSSSPRLWAYQYVRQRVFVCACACVYINMCWLVDVCVTALAVARRLQPHLQAPACPAPSAWTFYWGRRCSLLMPLLCLAMRQAVGCVHRSNKRSRRQRHRVSMLGFTQKGALEEGPWSCGQREQLCGLVGVRRTFLGRAGLGVQTCGTLVRCAGWRAAASRRPCVVLVRVSLLQYPGPSDRPLLNI